MKLITKELIKRFEEVGDQFEESNPVFVAKFFNPVGSATWYASNYDPETNICRGYVTGMFEDEWGYFSITEMESVRLPFGLGIERDIHFKETKANEIIYPNREAELQQHKNNSEKEQDF